MKLEAGLLAKNLKTTKRRVEALESFQKNKNKLFLRKTNKKEKAKYFLKYLKFLNKPYARLNKSINKKTWEKGWNENLNEIKKSGFSAKSFMPKYFRPSSYIRFNRKLWKCQNGKVEYFLFEIVREYLVRTFLKNSSTIIELGAGSGQNLFFLAKNLPQKKVIGTDWSNSCVKIYKIMGNKFPNISGKKLDMMKRKNKIKNEKNLAFLSIHSFEQLGGDFKVILNKILKIKPTIVVQLEPIEEFYDKNNTFDKLALLYHTKRNYLKKYFSELTRLERKKRIKIIKAFRPFIGGCFHEQSVLVWRPV